MQEINTYIYRMIKLSFRAKKKEYELDLQKGEDVLMALDKFLKKNKLDDTYFEKVKVDCPGQEDSVSCRIVKLVLSVLSDKNKN